MCNQSAINISKNPVQHLQAKHIDIQHHFICDLIEKSVLNLDYVKTHKQLSDILKKSLDAMKFD